MTLTKPYQNYAGAMVAQSNAQDEVACNTMLDTIQAEANHLGDTLDKIRGRLGGLADRTLGSSPTKGEAAGPAPVPNGSLASIIGTLTALHSMARDCNDIAMRLERIG